MTRQLILYRHAKSDWADPSQDDFDRGLTERGTRAARRMGRWFVENGYVPDVILCSDAVRAQTTLALTLDGMGDIRRPKIVSEHALYLASPSQILETISTVGSEAGTVMVVGHNPGLHCLAISLARGGPADDASGLAMKYPTAAATVIAVESDDWSELDAENCTLVRFQIPRALEA